MSCLKFWRKDRGSFTIEQIPSNGNPIYGTYISQANAKSLENSNDNNDIEQDARRKNKIETDNEIGVQAESPMTIEIGTQVEQPIFNQQIEKSNKQTQSTTPTQNHTISETQTIIQEYLPNKPSQSILAKPPPTYLEELKQRQSVLREKKLQHEEESQQPESQYDNEVFKTQQNVLSSCEACDNTEFEVDSKIDLEMATGPNTSLTDTRNSTLAIKSSKSMQYQNLHNNSFLNSTQSQKVKEHKTQKHTKKKSTDMTIAKVGDLSNVTHDMRNDSGVQVEVVGKLSDATATTCATDEEGLIDDDREILPSRAENKRKEGLIRRRPKLEDFRDKFIEVFKKDEKTKKLIRSAIESNDFLNNYMNDERKNFVIDAMEPASYTKGQYIVRENEEGSEIFVSEEGFFDIIKGDQIVNSLGPGCVFGELAVLYNARRFASVKAATKTKVWKIDHMKLQKIIVFSGDKEREENLQFLKSVILLKDLSEEVLLQIVDLLKRNFYKSNTCIVHQGDIGDAFYIIRGGSVTIKKQNDNGEERAVDWRKRGQYFGEQALINEATRTASVYADPPGTECLKLDRQAFIDNLGTIPELKEKPVDKLVPTEDTRYNPVIQNDYADIRLEALETVGVLGIGGFGRVELVRYERKTFALKILKKTEIVKQDQVSHVFSEKMAMSMCHSPFIVELYRTFRDNKYVYFLMEACLGGDVWSILHEKKYFDERTSKFIAACVVEAFDYLHTRNIIFRDLKPENLMITPNGYCKLVDFGFAKKLKPPAKTYTFAGTPEYVAPEIICDRGHDRAVDYWALGILIHELLCGKPPFRGRDQMKIYQKIITGIEAVEMTSRIPRVAQALIKHLCKQKPSDRLGCQRRGITDIKKHSWFDGFDWVKLEEKTMVAPIERPVKNNEDMRYFTTNREEDDIPDDEISGWDNGF